MTKVRLAFLGRKGEAFAAACMLDLLVATVLTMAGISLSDNVLFLVVLIMVLTIVGLTLMVPGAFWLQADDDGLTLVRLLLFRRTLPWSAVQGLAMRFHEEDEPYRHRLTLCVRLPDARDKDRFPGAFIGTNTITDDDRPRGTEPRELAHLFALFGERGLPVDKPEFADSVLAAHGLPPLPAQPTREGRAA